MKNEQKFTIIIPTRNRAQTLFWCLKSCLEQDYGNYEIIVSDNNSVDNTRNIVETYNSDKIKYFNTGKSLSMTENWEFALSKAANGGFVTFLGDDDGLMPNALIAANDYLNKYDVQAVVGRKDLYKWNNIAEQQQQGLLRYEVNRKTRIVNSREELHNVLFKTFDYTKLPCMYSLGFVSSDLIQSIKNKCNGVFFHSSIPDVYSAVVISLALDKYLFANTTFMLYGISSASNGNSFGNPNADKSVINSFVASNNIPFHSSLDFNPLNSVILAESVFQAADLKLTNDLISIKQLARLAFAEASYCKYEDIYKEAKESIRRIIVKNGIEEAYFDALAKKYPYKNAFQRNFKGYLESFNPQKAKNIKNLKAIVDNIYDASVENSKIDKNSFLQNNPISILLKWFYLKMSAK